MISPNKIIGVSNIPIFRNDGYDECLSDCGQFRIMLTPAPNNNRTILNIFRESDLSFLHSIKTDLESIGVVSIADTTVFIIDKNYEFYTYRWNMFD
jgi:hypothetical protein